MKVGGGSVRDGDGCVSAHPPYQALQIFTGPSFTGSWRTCNLYTYYNSVSAFGAFKIRQSVPSNSTAATWPRCQGPQTAFHRHGSRSAYGEDHLTQGNGGHRFQLHAAEKPGPFTEFVDCRSGHKHRSRRRRHRPIICFTAPLATSAKNFLSAQVTKP
jgi:hypothetical protein